MPIRMNEPHYATGKISALERYTERLKKRVKRWIYRLANAGSHSGHGWCPASKLLHNGSANRPVYACGSNLRSLTLMKLVIATLIMAFALVELNPNFENLAFDTKFIPVGGALSGFFGGLSGHQGALRTAFLIRTGLQKEVFIGTMVVSAVLVDISRLTVYGTTFFSRDFEVLKNQGGVELVIAGSLAAFVGAFIGSRLLKKITMRTIQIIVGIMLFFLSIAIEITPNMP